MTVVTSAGELLDALATTNDIEVDGSLSGMPAITLRPGARLRGGTFRFGAKGIRLTSDNQLAVDPVLRDRCLRCAHEPLQTLCCTQQGHV
jgi:hypothetical protein